MYYCRHTHRGILYLHGLAFFSFSNPSFLALAMVFPRGPFKPSGPFLQRVVAASLMISPFRHQALFLTMKFSSFGDASHSLKGGPSTSLLSNQQPRSTFLWRGEERERERVLISVWVRSCDWRQPRADGKRRKGKERRTEERRSKRKEVSFPSPFPLPFFSVFEYTPSVEEEPPCCNHACLILY